MSTAVTTLRILVRLSGLTLIVLGIIFWTGHGLGLIPAHMVIGLFLAVCLWALAFYGARARVSGGFVTLVVVWALVMLVFGAVQTRLLPGGAHWVVQVLHLLIGMGAIGIGDQLGTRIARTSFASR